MEVEALKNQMEKTEGNPRRKAHLIPKVPVI